MTRDQMETFKIHKEIRKMIGLPYSTPYLRMGGFAGPPVWPDQMSDKLKETLRKDFEKAGK